ncbi:hypothetical protein QJS10_CPA05g01397 [Acorus calamus]|uniref:Uncharacterized protein n=1 Tax=Acorus calamus TaxID=4465 RepID=A0AAV9EQB9_ACOCL|nr:hypothetical protein QJS10_CPA05g01397 [Acorus calamus]
MKPFDKTNISGALGLITEKKLHTKMDPKKAGATKLPKFDAARTDALFGVDDEDDDLESRTSTFVKRHSASPATNRSTGLCRLSETHFDWASVDTYSDSSTDLCHPSEEHFN